MSIRIASRGASRTLPNLSSETNVMIWDQVVAKAKNTLKIIDVLYPRKMNLLRRPVLSESQPPSSFTKLARPSLSPEIKPIARPVPPNDAIRNGRSGVIISLPTSLAILEPPRRYMFLSPFFFFIIPFQLDIRRL